MGGGAGLLERVGHDDGNGLAVVVDQVVLQQGEGGRRLFAFGRRRRSWQARRVLRRDDGDHARHGQRRRDVEPCDAPIGDGRQDHQAVGHVRHGMFGRIHGAARDFQAGVDAVDALSDVLHDDAPA
jgi:hypothetical protein